jgi:Zn-dependent peptidase ImmA (M78 family)
MSYPTTKAVQLIDALGIREKSDLLRLDEIAWMRGVLVNYEALEGTEARLVAAKGRGVITVSTTISDSRRKRFSIAHELGHFELHKEQRGLSLCVNQDIGGESGPKQPHDLEDEANEFASALLMPEIFFAPLCEKDEPSISLVSSLANEFSTSLTATALRYLKYCDEQVVLIYSENERIRWFQGSAEFETLREDLGIFLDVRARLDPTTLAAKLFDNPNLFFKKRKIDASCWFTSGKFRKDATIIEDSLAMPNYNSVLTLLWVNDDLEEEDFD